MNNPLPLFQFLQQKEKRQIPLDYTIMYNPNPSAEDLQFTSNQKTRLDISHLNGLHVDGNLTFTDDNDDATALPDNLHVTGYLYAIDSTLSTINPSYNIHVGNLILKGSAFIINPNDRYDPKKLRVDEILHCVDTPLETLLTRPTVFDEHKAAIASLILCVGEMTVFFGRPFYNIQMLENYLTHAVW